MDALVRLTARLLDARVIRLDERAPHTALQRGASAIPRFRSASSRGLLVITPNPAHLAQAARVRHWLPGHATIVAWVIDSFWTYRIARFTRTGRHFDHLFITDPGLRQEWAPLTDAPVSVLPWGADTLTFPLRDGDRSTDLLRVGRQPPAWDDDAATARLAVERGLRFQGRPPLDPADPACNYEHLRQAPLRSRFMLAFSNLVSPASYTHPTRDYLTGRWTDALAAGAVVVGAAPSGTLETLWETATVEVSPTDPAAGLERIAELSGQWSPEAARAQQLLARQRLDWRHRLRTLCEVLEIPETPLLTRELQHLEAAARAPHRFSIRCESSSTGRSWPAETSGWWAPACSADGPERWPSSCESPAQDWTCRPWLLTGAYGPWAWSAMRPMSCPRRSGICSPRVSSPFSWRTTSPRTVPSRSSANWPPSTRRSSWPAMPSPPTCSRPR